MLASAVLPQRTVTSGVRSRAEDIYRVPRWFYYAGMATLGLLTLRPAAQTTLSDFLFLAAFALAIAVMLLNRTSAGYIDPKMLLGALLYGIGGLASALNTETASGSIEVVLKFMFLVVGWLWLGTVVLTDMSHVRLAMTLWILSVGASGAAAVAQLVFGDVVPGSSPVWGRMTGFTSHMNDLGGASAVAFVAGVALVWALPNSRGKAVAALGTSLCLAGLILSGSVGAFLGAAVAFCALMVFHLHVLRKAFVLIAIGVAAAALITMQEQHGGVTPALRFEQTTSSGGSLSQRVEIYSRAMDRIAANPLTGVGPQPGGSLIEGRPGTQVHSALLATWYEAGLIGLAGFLLAVFAALARGFKALEAEDKRSLLAIGLLWAFLAYLAFGLTAPTLYVRYGWVPVALLHALKSRTEAQ